MKTYTDIYEETILAHVVDNKERHVAFAVICWDCDGEIFASVQKGLMVNGEFKKFGAWQRGRQYQTDLQAIKSARVIAKNRISKLQAA